MAFRTVLTDLEGCERNMKMSSAYNDNFWTSLPIVTPVISEFCLIAVASGLRARTNSNGERGHPCLVLL